MNIESGEQEEAASTDHAAVHSVPVVVDREHHCISRNLIPENTLKVLYRLHRSGFKAYLCGGSVRDLLMGRTPKDFDIATPATQEDVPVAWHAPTPQEVETAV